MKKALLILIGTLLILTTSCSGNKEETFILDKCGIRNEDCYVPIRKINEAEASCDWEKIISVNLLIRAKYEASDNKEEFRKAWEEQGPYIIKIISIDSATYLSRQDLATFSLEKQERIGAILKYCGYSWDDVSEAYLITQTEHYSRDEDGRNYACEYLILNLHGCWYMCDCNITYLQGQTTDAEAISKEALR